MGQANFEYGKNLQAAIQQGADPAALQKMIDDLGPQAGLALQQLVQGGRKAIDDFNAAAGRAERGADSLATGLDVVAAAAAGIDIGSVTRALDGLPKEVVTNIKTNGVPRTFAEVDALVERYNLTEKERRALITLKDNASHELDAILRKMGLLRDKTVTVTTVITTTNRGS